MIIAALIPIATGIDVTKHSSTPETSPFTIDLIDTVFKTNGGSIGDSDTFNIDVRNVSSGLPGTTLDATDTVTFTSAAAVGTNQDVHLTSADLTNISAFAFQSNTAYSVVFYHLTHSGSLTNLVAMERDSSHGPGTTVSYSDGFSTAGFFQNTILAIRGHFRSHSAIPSPRCPSLLLWPSPASDRSPLLHTAAADPCGASRPLAKGRRQNKPPPAQSRTCRITMCGSFLG